MFLDEHRTMDGGISEIFAFDYLGTASLNEPDPQP